MKKKILFLLLGLFISFTITSVIQSLNYVFFDISKDIDYRNKEQVAEMMRNLPVMALVVVEISYILGAFGGAFVYSFGSGSDDYTFPVGIGIFLTFMGYLNLVNIPHPLWFSILSTLTYIPMTLVGRFTGFNYSEKRRNFYSNSN